MSYVNYIIDEPIQYVMSEYDLNSKERIEQLKVPSEINSNTAKLVYVYLKSVKESTLEQLCESLSLKKITVLPILSILDKNNFIEKSNQTYVVV